MFALRYLEGFSNQEIGRLVGTSESTVGVTLFRARAQLRAALDGVAADLA
jgi:RNA polymerase sigma factor (sigma-70 family)